MADAYPCALPDVIVAQNAIVLHGVDSIHHRVDLEMIERIDNKASFGKSCISQFLRV